MAIYSGMFKVYSCRAVSTDDNLELRDILNLFPSRQTTKTYLIIPPVGACPNLLASFQAISSTQKVIAQVSEAIWCGVIQAYDEKRIVDKLQTGFVMLVFRKHDPET